MLVFLNTTFCKTQCNILQAQEDGVRVPQAQTENTHSAWCISERVYQSWALHRTDGCRTCFLTDSASHLALAASPRLPPEGLRSPRVGLRGLMYSHLLPTFPHTGLLLWPNHSSWEFTGSILFAYNLAVQWKLGKSTFLGMQ